VAAFDLFARLMGERAHEQLLLGDISAAFQINRRVEIARTLVEREDWHPRLLHGSDYPLPGIPVLTRPRRLADAGLLDESAIDVLSSIRDHNPLLFDFVLKRSLRLGERRLPAAVFETRRHFVAA
jgi:mannonate dehydratase